MVQNLVKKKSLFWTFSIVNSKFRIPALLPSSGKMEVTPNMVDFVGYGVQ